MLCLTRGRDDKTQNGATTEESFESQQSSTLTLCSAQKCLNGKKRKDVNSLVSLLKTPPES